MSSIKTCLYIESIVWMCTYIHSTSSMQVFSFSFKRFFKNMLPVWGECKFKSLSTSHRKPHSPAPPSLPHPAWCFTLTALTVWTLPQRSVQVVLALSSSPACTLPSTHCQKILLVLQNGSTSNLPRLHNLLSMCTYVALVSFLCTLHLSTLCIA